MLNKEKEWLRKRCSDKWKKWSFRNTVRGLLPITEWLPKYKLKKDLPADIAAGLTLGIMNIPQGKCMYVPLSVSKQITPSWYLPGKQYEVWPSFARFPKS
jgi:hypothetical protein